MKPHVKNVQLSKPVARMLQGRQLQLSELLLDVLLHSYLHSADNSHLQIVSSPQGDPCRSLSSSLLPGSKAARQGCTANEACSAEVMREKHMDHSWQFFYSTAHLAGTLHSGLPTIRGMRRFTA